MAKKKQTPQTTDALDILWQKHYEGNPQRIAALQLEQQNAAIAHAVYNLRTAAKLTQKELADLIGTKASAISRLENADYGVRSLMMLNKIAAVFMGRLKMSIVPLTSSRTYLRAPSGEKISKEQILA